MIGLNIPNLCSQRRELAGDLDAGRRVAMVTNPAGPCVTAFPHSGESIPIGFNLFAGAVGTRWFHTATGQAIAVLGSPFVPRGQHPLILPGNNAAGDADWVLVIENATPSASAPQGTRR